MSLYIADSFVMLPSRTFMERFHSRDYRPYWFTEKKKVFA